MKNNRTLSLTILCLLVSFQLFSQDVVDGQVFIKFKSKPGFESITGFSEIGLFPDHLNKLIEGANGQLSTLFPFDDDIMERIYMLEIDSKGIENELIEEFSKLDIIEYAERVPIYHTSYTPNDLNINQWYLPKILAENAWDSTMGSADVGIAIVDDAVLLSHADLAPEIYINPGEIAANGMDDDNNGYIDDVSGWDAGNFDNDPNPPSIANGSVFSHGTHVAGIAAAATDNNLGMASIGFNCKIIPVKATPDNVSNGALTHTVQGVSYAIASGARVVNMSFGGPFHSRVMQDLIDFGHSQCIVFVAAAGNSNSSLNAYPAAYNHVIAVGATDQNDAKTWFSNYGSYVDVMAPGLYIWSTVPPASNYANKSGTSMASPLAAGLIGAMIAFNPCLCTDSLEACLKNSCDNIDAQNPGFIGQLGAGRINALKAVQHMVRPPEADFVIGVPTICPNQSLNLANTSCGMDVLTYNWSMPGSSTPTSSLENPAVSYASEGTYNITLIVCNKYGCDTVVKSIVVAYPNAVISGSTTIVRGQNAFIRINFTGMPPFRVDLHDGTNTYTYNNIYPTSYLVRVSPLITTPFWLSNVSDANCPGTPEDTAIITVLQDTTLTPCTDLQTFNTVYDNTGETYGYSIIKTSDDDYMVAGVTGSSGAGGTDLYLARFDELGQFQWGNTYGGTGTEDASSSNVIETYDGNFVFVGYTQGFGAVSWDNLIVKVDPNGNIIWQTRVGGSSAEHGRDVIETADSGLVFIAHQGNVGAGSSEYWVYKLDANGNLQWSTTIGGNAQEHCLGLLESQTGHLIIVGSTNSTSNGINASSHGGFFVKLDGNGNYVTSRVHDATSFDMLFKAVELPSGNFLITGKTNSFGNDFQVLLTKTDPDGNAIWSQHYGGPLKDEGYHIDLDSDGNVIIGGITESFGNGRDLFFLKTDTSGNLIWNRTFGGSGTENPGNTAFHRHGHMFHINEDNSMAFVGNTTSYGGTDNDLYIQITDQQGNGFCDQDTQTLVTGTANLTVTTPTPTISSNYVPLTVNLTVLPMTMGNIIVCDSLVSCPDNDCVDTIRYQVVLDDNLTTSAESIIPGIDGDFIIAGRTTAGAGGTDIFVAKIDRFSNVIWMKTYGSTLSDLAVSVRITALEDSTYMVCGYKAAGRREMTLFRIDLLGNKVWERSYSRSQYDDHGHMGISTNDGGFLVTGHTGQSGKTSEGWHIKFDASGNLLWHQTYGGPRTDHQRTLIELPSSNYYAIGTTESFGVNPKRIWINKFDPNGSLLQSFAFGDGIRNHYHRGSIMLSDSSIVTSGSYDNAGNNRDILILKSEATGNVVWCKTIFGSGEEFAPYVRNTPDGGFIVAGKTESFGSGNRDLFLLKLDENGNKEWMKTYGGTADDDIEGNTGFLVTNTEDGGFMLVGHTSSFGGSDKDIYIIKTDHLGNSGSCNETIVTDTLADFPITAYSVTGVTFSGANSSVSMNYTVGNHNATVDTLCFDYLPCIEGTLDTFPCDSGVYYMVEICHGDSIQISAGTGANYYWTPDYNISDDTIQNPIVYPDTSTRYFGLYTDTNGCQVLDTVDVIVHPIPDTIALSDTTLCLGDSLVITVPNGDSVVFSPSTGIDFNNPPTLIIKPTGSIDYQIEIIDSNGCSVTQSISITVDSCCQYPKGFFSSDTAICITDTVSFTNMSVAKGSATYQWFFGAGASPSSFNGFAPPSVSYPSTGVYTAQLIVTDDCGTDTTLLDIYVYELADSFDLRDSIICLGDSIQIGVTPISTYNYLWTPGSFLSDSLLGDPIAFPSDTTEFILTVTDRISGCTITDTLRINVINNPPNIVGDSIICSLDTIQLCVDPYLPDYISWSSGQADSCISVITDTDTIIWASHCNITDTHFIRNNTVALQVSATDTLVCVGANITLSATGAGNYVWEHSGQTDSIITVSIPDTSTYRVIGSDLSTTCFDTADITIYTASRIKANIQGDTLICEGDSLVLTATPSTGIIWENGDTNSSIIIVPTADTTIYLLGIDTGCISGDTHSITVAQPLRFGIGFDTTMCPGDTLQLNIAHDSILVNGVLHGPSITIIPGTDSVIILNYLDYPCLNGFDTINIVMAAPLQLTIIADTQICIGDSVTLTVNPGNGIVWNNGSTDSVITIYPLDDSIFTVSSINDNCILPDTIMVLVDTPPMVNITGDTVICSGQSTTLSITNSGGILWSTSATSNSISVSPGNNANYSVTVNSGACSSTDTIGITVFSYPSLTIDDNVIICAGNSVSLSASSNFGNLLWSTGATSNSINVTPANITVYTVTASNDTFGGCAVIDSITVNIHNAFGGFQFKDTICVGDSVIVNIPHDSVSINNQLVSNPLVLHPTDDTLIVLTFHDYPCADVLDTICIIVHQYPVVSFDTLITIDDQGIQLNLPVNYNYCWSPSDGLSCDACPNPFVNPFDDILYQVNVYDTDTSCSIDLSLNVIVDQQCLVTIPNIFTPNDDGINDEFIPLMHGIQYITDFRIKIFSRWGEDIFESTSTTIGWNGTHDGKHEPAGTYVYLIEYRCAGELRKYTGPVTLIR